MPHFDITDLQTYLKMNNNLLDSSGNGNDGTGGSVFAPGKLQEHFQLQGRCILANPANFGKNANEPFSISFWIKSDNPPGSRPDVILDNETASTGYRLTYFGGSGLINWRVNATTGGASLTSTFAPISDSTHHLITLIYAGNSDSDGIKLFIDNTLDRQGGSGVMTGTIGGNPLTLGSTVSGQDTVAADVSMDDFQFWDKELSQTEITALWNNGDGSELVHQIIKGRTLVRAISRITDLILRKNRDTLVGVLSRLTNLILRKNRNTLFRTNSRTTDIRRKL